MYTPLVGRGGGKVVRAAKTFVLLPVETGKCAMIALQKIKHTANSQENVF